ncbi:MAG: hypothetical protein ACLSAF_21935 [Intestinimonas sp.]
MATPSPPFFKAKDGAAYAIARNADYTYSSYRYDGAAWTRLDGLPGALVSASSDGKLLVGLGTRRYDGAYPERATPWWRTARPPPPHPAVSSSALGGYWTLTAAPSPTRSSKRPSASAGTARCTPP